MDSLKTEKPMAFLSRDQLIRRFTVMSLENCELLTLSVKDILKMRLEFPNIFAKIIEDLFKIFHQ